MSDVSGKRIAITGPTSGIGMASTLELARRGAKLVLFCRNPEKGGALANEVEALGAERPQIVQVDMADLGSVRRAAEDYLSRDIALDVLLNNAGVINLKRRETVDNFEETLAVNHLAHFLLTGLLLPSLLSTESPRVVNVSSGAHAFVRDMGFDDIQAERQFKVFRQYGRSKLANILFTRELADRYRASGLTANCLHPGAVATSLGKTNGGIAGRILPALLKPFFRSPEQGAQTSIYLCSSDTVAVVSGEYFVDCKPTRPKRWALDKAAAEQLWEYSEQCVGFSYPDWAGPA